MTTEARVSYRLFPRCWDEISWDPTCYPGKEQFPEKDDQPSFLPDGDRGTIGAFGKVLGDLKGDYSKDEINGYLVA